MTTCLWSATVERIIFVDCVRALKGRLAHYISCRVQYNKPLGIRRFALQEFWRRLYLLGRRGLWFFGCSRSQDGEIVGWNEVLCRFL